VLENAKIPLESLAAPAHNPNPPSTAVTSDSRADSDAPPSVRKETPEACLPDRFRLEKIHPSLAAGTTGSDVQTESDMFRSEKIHPNLAAGPTSAVDSQTHLFPSEKSRPKLPAGAALSAMESEADIISSVGGGLARAEVTEVIPGTPAKSGQLAASAFHLLTSTPVGQSLLRQLSVRRYRWYPYRYPVSYKGSMEDRWDPKPRDINSLRKDVGDNILDIYIAYTGKSILTSTELILGLRGLKEVGGRGG
jgi:hypothetical protein